MAYTINKKGILMYSSIKYMITTLSFCTTLCFEKRIFPDYFLNKEDEEPTLKSLRVLLACITPPQVHEMPFKDYVYIDPKTMSFNKNKNRFYIRNYETKKLP
jgi:hypothetical protein